jgi:hypothetical protein
VGILSEGIGVQYAIGGFASALVLLSLYFIIFQPKIRKL